MLQNKNRAETTQKLACAGSLLKGGSEMNAMNNNFYSSRFEHSNCSWWSHSFSGLSWCECWRECNSSNCNESIFESGVSA